MNRGVFKRVITMLVLTCILTSILVLDTAAAGYSDTKGHWAEEAIDRWTE